MTLKPQIYNEDIKVKMCGAWERIYMNKTNLGSPSSSLHPW